MGFAQAIGICFRKWLIFRGRASRSEFWYFCLFYSLAIFASKTLDYGFGLDFYTLYIPFRQGVIAHDVQQLVLTIGNGPIEWACYVATVPPCLAVIVRRLHDGNRSGWWYWISLTIIGIVPLLIWLCQKGTDGGNRYGPDPLISLEGSATSLPKTVHLQSNPSADFSEQLTRLAALNASGHLSDEEFRHLKTRLLTRTSAVATPNAGLPSVRLFSGP